MTHLTGTQLQERRTRDLKRRSAKDPMLPFRRAARDAVGAARNQRVEVLEDSNAAPQLVGESGGMCLVGHPTGPGWEYSTLRVVVGRQWRP